VETYLHSPLPDGKITNVMDWSALAKGVQDHLNRGGTALIQCHAGRNRSGFLAALVVARTMGMTGEEAMEFVRIRRPRAIANPHFEDYLRSLS
jgi:protein-tyrosine phosphatase